MSSAAEAELDALFINAKEAAYIHNILEELGHEQPRTPIQTDNSTAEMVGCTIATQAVGERRLKNEFNKMISNCYKLTDLLNLPKLQSPIQSCQGVDSQAS